MATPFSTFITRLRYSLQDTEIPYVYSDVVVKAWINAGNDRINRESPFILTNGDLTGVDGATYSFDLATIFATFLRLRSITPIEAGAKPLTLHPQGMAYIRYLLANSGLVAGTPFHYVSQGTTVYCNSIPASGLTMTVDYYKTATALTDDAHTPEGLLSSGWDLLILNMAKIEAGFDIPDELGKRLQTEGILFCYGDPRIREPGELDKFKAWVIDELGHFDEKEAAPYADIRGGIGSSVAGSSDFEELW